MPDGHQGEPLLPVAKTRKWRIAKAAECVASGAQPSYMVIRDWLTIIGISGLVVKSIVAIDGPRVRFTADAQ
jgi:hypothetical protein